MVNTFQLGSLYQNLAPPFKELSVLEKEIHAYLIGERVSIDNILSDFPDVSSYKDLFLTQLLVRLIFSDPSPYDPALLAISQKAKRSSWEEHSQVVRVLTALFYNYGELPELTVHPHLLTNGAALLDLEGCCPWRQLPYNPLHAEFGVYLLLLALRKQDEKLLNEGLRMARWQINTLSDNFKPFLSLFARYKPHDLAAQLPWNALFFEVISHLSDCPLMKEVAKRQLEIVQKENYRLEPSLVFMERVLEKEIAKREGRLLPTLPASFNHLFMDSTTALAGYRKQDLNVYSTLHGCYTGMGCFLLKNRGIINFGPHHLPLNVAAGFGIEGNDLSDRGMRKSVIRANEEGYSLKGCVRLVDFLSDKCQFSGIWLETSQEFIEDRLEININYLGFEGWGSSGFSFFIKTSHCEIEGVKRDQYKGIPVEIKFKDGENTLLLEPSSKYGQMEISTLSTGASHWGANLLVTFYPDLAQSEYKWVIAIAK